MSSPSRRSLTPLIGPSMNLVGSVAAIGGFFLPWTFTYDHNSFSGSLSLHGHTGWDIASRVFLPQATSVDQNFPAPDPTTAPAVFFMLALPLVMAAIALIVTGVGLAKPSALLKGLNIAAIQIGFFALFGEALYAFLLSFAPTISSNITYPIGLGFPILFLGYFLLIAGTITHALSGQAASAASAA